MLTFDIKIILQLRKKSENSEVNHKEKLKFELSVIKGILTTVL